MVKFEQKVDSIGRVYLVKEIRDMLGEKIVLIPNAFAVAMFSKDANLQNVRKSLKLILKDIELRMENEGEENAKTS